MRPSFTPLSFLSVLAIPAVDASACDAWVRKLHRPAEKEAVCYCSENELQQVKAAHPKSVTLQVVCDLTNTEGRLIDLKRQSVVMDRDDEIGNGVLLGSFFFKGSLVLSGTVQVLPDSEAGAGFLLFNADPSIENSGSFFGRSLRAFKMYKPEHYKSLGVTAKMRSGKCLSAPATLRLEDPVVVMAETDVEGTYPSRISALHVGRYKPCGAK
ncbi:MAG TPA: hypothetical protein VFF03_06955 [Rhodocyclaceae bacterium]|nr:hypothetical protein [Rhodocyclaceae bacterium]